MRSQSILASRNAAVRLGEIDAPENTEKQEVKKMNPSCSEQVIMQKRDQAVLQKKHVTHRLGQCGPLDITGQWAPSSSSVDGGLAGGWLAGCSRVVPRPSA